jgi:hypothetical protein
MVIRLIVMKSMEKDRTRCYGRERHGTRCPAVSLICRSLAPSTYCLRKFVRRNRVAVIAAAA